MVRNRIIIMSLAISLIAIATSGAAWARNVEFKVDVDNCLGQAFAGVVVTADLWDEDMSTLKESYTQVTVLGQLTFNFNSCVYRDKLHITLDPPVGEPDGNHRFKYAGRSGFTNIDEWDLDKSLLLAADCPDEGDGEEWTCTYNEPPPD